MVPLGKATCRERAVAAWERAAVEGVGMMMGMRCPLADWLGQQASR